MVNNEMTQHISSGQHRWTFLELRHYTKVGSSTGWESPIEQPASYFGFQIEAFVQRRRSRLLFDQAA